MIRQISAPSFSCIRPAVNLPAACVALALGGVLLPAQAGEGPTQSIAEKEIARRHGLTQEAMDLLQQGHQARRAKDLAAAVDAYQKAVEILPRSPATLELRGQALLAFSEASVARAEELAVQARYDEANRALDTVLQEGWNPEYEPALRLKEQIQDPERYNPAATPAHIEKVQHVSRELALAEGHYALGEFDKARESYHRVLAADRYNTAARRGLEKIDRRVTAHHLSSRDHTRADMLRQVDEHWATAVPQAGLAPGETPLELGGSGGLTTREKARRIILPQVQLIDATMDEVAQFLALQSKNYDTLEPDPDKKGVNIVLGGDGTLASRRITLSLSDVPLDYVIQTVARLAGTDSLIGDYLVTIGPADGAQLSTRTFRVSPSFFSTAPVSAPTAADPFAASGPDSGGSSGLSFARVDPKDFLTQNGVSFPEGSAAMFSPVTGVLTVRNTAGNLDLVHTLVEQAGIKTPSLIKIRSTMIEVNQETIQEMGYDWLLGQFNVGGDRVFSSGGTSGNQPGGDAQTMAQNFPLIPPTAGSAPVGQYPLTAGNRSGNGAILPNSIDSLLRTGERNPNLGIKAPSVFGLSGVLTDPQFQVVLRGLNQKKGVDLSSSPEIIAKSGQRAVVEILREFPYPTEFEPPEIPQDFGGGGSVLIDLIGGTITTFGGGGGQFPVTPTTPTAFEVEKLGHRLEVEATLGADNRTIDLDISPAYSEFEGFINYGSPIRTYEGNTPIVLTENRIVQPVFRRNAAPGGIKITLWSGSTMVIAGLATDERTTVEDKTPVFGDLPFIGRFFRSTAEQVRTKAVIFMVTATVVDPSGENLHSGVAAQN